MKIVILGLTITSSWGNGHATTFRGLVRETAARGHDVLFLERDTPWYRDNRDLPHPPYCRLGLYQSLDELERDWRGEVASADAVIIGSYVPDGVAVGRWATEAATSGVCAFYDIDTPVTLAKLERGDEEYLSRDLIPRYDLYLSFTGGPTLERLERDFGSPCARPLYCAVDPALYFPEPSAGGASYDLGYMGTYSDDRQPPLDHFLLEPARMWSEGRFAVAGPQYPATIEWPANVTRVEHLPPSEHRAFYNAQRWTLNITRADMIRAGYSPSVRLFEAAACGTPILSDNWPGLSDFFTPGEEIVTVATADDALRALRETPDTDRLLIAERARARVLGRHTAAHRAEELEGYLLEAAR